MLRSIWREFREQLAAIGVRGKDPSFKKDLGDTASNIYLKSGGTGIEIGIALQCRDEDDSMGRFAVYSWVWVKDPDLRKSLDHHVATHLSDPFVHDFEKDGITYITAYLDLTRKSQAIDLLRASFALLFECLFGSPEFSKSYGLSGPASKGVSTVIEGS